MKSETNKQFAFNLESPAKLRRDPDERALRLRQASQLTGPGSIDDLSNAGGRTVSAAHQAGRAGCGMAGERSARLVGDAPRRR